MKAKEDGTTAMKNRDFPAAKEKFELALSNCKNDPESLIYLNNAKVSANTSNLVAIAVSVPISSNPNVAQEMLRGVAQAQKELLDEGTGIAGRFLKVMIADDHNLPEFTEPVAKALVKSDVLAVVGSNASRASLSAAPIYEKAGLVMISPTSVNDNLTATKNAIFRTIPSTYVMTEALAKHIVSIRQGKSKIAICYDHTPDGDSSSFANAFTANLGVLKAEVANIDCNLHKDSNLKAEDFVKDAANNGVNGILIVPDIDYFKNALAIAHVAKNLSSPIPLYSTATMFTWKTLEEGKEAVLGMSLAVVWDRDQKEADRFVEGAGKLWGKDAPVNWRTAMSYDATKAIITGLINANDSINRNSLLLALHNKKFSAAGASGEIKFLSTGDRQLDPILVKVKKREEPDTGYGFVKIVPQTAGVTSNP
jgi:branched-chain amino acid transport system substrate-binding protein